jgi:hypothetical protein
MVLNAFSWVMTRFTFAGAVMLSGLLHVGGFTWLRSQPEPMTPRAPLEAVVKGRRLPKHQVHCTSEAVARRACTAS